MIAFAVQQMHLWTRLIQWWRHVLYPTPVLLWSLFFLGKVATTTIFHTAYFLVFLSLTLHFLLGGLLFPRMEGLIYKSSYTYIDVYEELRQKRFWVFGIAFLAEFLLCYQHWALGQVFSFTDLGYCGLFLAAALTEHKGLMLVWVWLGLGALLW
ncbi:MAG: hypothetical protein ACRBFS_01850 [Aureispira sp.]